MYGQANLYMLMLLALFLLLILAVRPWYNTWGADDNEMKMPLPGDRLLTDTRTQVTRGITINAPVSSVWPWIVQMGYQRAGWYNYDWINGLLGAADFVDGQHSSQRIVPELQNLQIGDMIFIAPVIAYQVETIEPDRVLVLYSEDRTQEHSWVYMLASIDPNTTRLIVRHRDNYSGLTNRVIFALIEPGSFLMERKHLLGIKARAEALNTNSFD